MCATSPRNSCWPKLPWCPPGVDPVYRFGARQHSLRRARGHRGTSGGGGQGRPGPRLYPELFPEGYNTRVEAAGPLFRRPKQRLAIARALLTKARILILDNSTSAVDTETETKIQDALDLADFQRTTLVVAQRISTVLKADKIIVIEKGRVAAEGTQSGAFAEQSHLSGNLRVTIGRRPPSGPAG